MKTFFIDLKSDLLKKVTDKTKPNKKKIIIGVLILIIFAFFYFNINLTFGKIYDLTKPQPRVLVTEAIGRHLIGEEYAPADRPTYLMKVDKNLNYMIFEMKNDYNMDIPEIFFVLDSEEYCPECYYFTLVFENLGKVDAENIVYDLDTFTNKIQVFNPDRRIKVSDSFGQYGRGGVRFTLDILRANESASVSIRVDDPPKKSVHHTCTVDGKEICRVGDYYYNLLLGRGDYVVVDDSKVIFLEEIKEGLYKINLKTGEITPLSFEKIISEKEVINFE